MTFYNIHSILVNTNRDADREPPLIAFTFLKMICLTKLTQDLKNIGWKISGCHGLFHCHQFNSTTTLTGKENQRTATLFSFGWPNIPWPKCALSINLIISEKKPLLKSWAFIGMQHSCTEFIRSLYLTKKSKFSNAAGINQTFKSFSYLIHHNFVLCVPAFPFPH